MWQFSNVTFSQYQARYSPFTVQFLTRTFLACQKASLVSKVQSSKTALLMYWKEYLPLNVTSLKRISSLLIMKYSPSAFDLSISTERLDHPNSGLMMSQSAIFMLLHSLSALMPCIFVPLISMLSEYRAFSVSRPVKATGSYCQVPAPVERAFLIEFLILNYIHISFSLFSSSYTR